MRVLLLLLMEVVRARRQGRDKCSEEGKVRRERKRLEEREGWREGKCDEEREWSGKENNEGWRKDR